ncbi:glycosyltransferase family protein [Psychrobacter aquimaris]|uniref:glycosyltransferase n=1 Tax=Psychrobacter aquimaris TaxID=292733 RepID=UPI0018DF69B1|nr:glycosyltransferase [Psychrobacter aquimaris]
MTEDNKPSVAILYIATGRYTVFWEYFYRSAEKHLLPNSNKHYVLFTDNLALISKQTDYPNVTMIKQEALGWPYSTLMRFKFFLGARSIIEKYDFIFYFNANTEFLSDITEDELLPLDHHEELSLGVQPHMFHLNKRAYTYDRNPQSQAYIPYHKGKYYFTGALNGGKSHAYLQMCETLNQNTELDLKNNVIALWHDESQLNKFALDRTDIKVLPPYFTRGEHEYWKKSSKIMFSDKTHYRFGGHAYLRAETNDKITKSDWEQKNGKRRRKLNTRFKQYIASLFF